MLKVRKFVLMLAAALLAAPASGALLTFDFSARIDRPNSLYAVGTLLNGRFSYDNNLLPTFTEPAGSGIYLQYQDPSITLSFNILGESYSGSALSVVEEGITPGDGTPYDDGMGLIHLGPETFFALGVSDPMGTAFSASLPTSFPVLHQGPFLDANDDDELPVPSGEFSFYDTKRDGWFDATILAITPRAAVPEPASWLMLIVGFGLIGGMLRSSWRRPFAAL